MSNKILLDNTYKQLGLTFKLNDTDHLHIKPFDCHAFMFINWDNKLYTVYGYKNSPIYFKNIYEILLWYYYWSHKYIHIGRRNSNGCINQSYFSRIPPYHRNLEPKKGLHMIKNILDGIIIESKGLPEY